MNNFFQDHKTEIQQGIQRVAQTAGLSGDLTLVDGLVFMDIQNNPNVISIGGARIPMVVVIDNQTGKIHQFALKIICPNLTI